MYRRELENLINSNALPKAIFLYGACNYQIDYFGEKIKDCYLDGTGDALSFYFDEYNFSTLKQYLSQSSLFGDRNVAILKTQKTILKKELDTLISICKKSDNSFLLVQSYDEQKAKNMTKSFTKKAGGEFVRFFKPYPQDAIKFMQEKAKKLRLNIQPYALQHLLLTHNEDLSLAIGELPKLSILEHEVTKDDIDRLVFGLGAVGLDSFIGNLVDKKDIKDYFIALTQSGEYDEIYIINSIQNYINQLFLFHAYTKLNGTFDAKAVLGYPLPPDIAKKRGAQCMRIKLKTYEKILKNLAFAEAALKRGSFKDKNTYLLSVLLSLQKNIQ